jgi:hypothetical protein
VEFVSSSVSPSLFIEHHIHVNELDTSRVYAQVYNNITLANTPRVGHVPNANLALNRM